MKRLIYIMAVMALAISCGPREKDSFTISGKVFDYNGFATLRFLDPQTEEIVADTVDLVNGEFSFSGHISEPAFGQIILFQDNGCTIRSSLVVENYDIVANDNPGYMVIDGPNVLTARNLFYHGSRNNDAIQEINNSYAFLDEEPQFKGIADIYQQMNNCGADDLNKFIELQTSLKDKYGSRIIKKYDKARNEAMLNYIKKHGNIEICAYFLQQCGAQDMPLDELEEIFNGLSKKVQDSDLAYGIRQQIKERQEKEKH